MTCQLCGDESCACERDLLAELGTDGLSPREIARRQLERDAAAYLLAGKRIQVAEQGATGVKGSEAVNPVAIAFKRARVRRGYLPAFGNGGHEVRPG